MNLKIYMRKYQLKNLASKNVVYQGSNPSTISAVLGDIPNNDWKDFTNSIANYEKLALSWSVQHDDNGEVATGSLQVQKGVSNSLQFEREAYNFLKDWLVSNVACKVNAVEVHIVDEDCGVFTGYMIRSSQLSWCEDGLCTYEITLKQLDPMLACLRSSPISDNWQGWFPTQEQPVSTKKHPRFSYCVEMRPNAILVIGWFNLGALGGITYLLALILTPIVNTIIAIVNAFKFIANVLTGADKEYTKFFDPSVLLDYFKILFVESAGCGREHPAPLESDYIRNICDKCKIKYDANTIPIFFADTLSMTTSTSKGQIETFKNPYKYACYLDAPQKRGVRRFNDLHMFKASQQNTSYWVKENAPLETLDMHLNKIKDVFNAEWRIIDGTLYFNRKDQFLNEGAIYDFSANGADRGKLINGICYEPYIATVGSYCRGLYTVDSIDTSGNESDQANGMVSFGSVALNPNFTSGPLDKTTQFSAARFRLDGGTNDYIMDAMQVIANGQILQPWLIPQLRDVSSEISKYCDYALLMGAETTFAPKILLWDGVSYDNARCIGSAGAVDNYSAPNALQMVAIKTTTDLSTGDQVPEINYDYPLEYDYTTGNAVFSAFKDVHKPKTFVQGSTFISNKSHEEGLYQVDDNYAGKFIYRAVARLVNYPMYFGPQWKGTMWDRFHFIDDPRFRPQMNWNWSAKMPLCCDDVKRLKLDGDGMGVKLHTKVILTAPFDGRITQITASFDSSNEYGKYIELKGEC